MANSMLRALIALMLCAAFTSCGDVGGRNSADKGSQSTQFEPTITVQCRSLPGSAGEDLLDQLQDVVKETVNQKKRVTLVEDPAAARLLFDVEFYLEEKSFDPKLCYRLQVIDNEHGILLFEKAAGISVDNSASTEGDHDAIKEGIRQEFEDLAKRLESSSRLTSQVELGDDGIAYLEAGPALRDETIVYGRHQMSAPQPRVFIDYSLSEIENGWPGVALRIAMNRVYKMLRLQEIEVVTSREAADFAIEVVSGLKPGQQVSYARVIDGEAAPVATDSGADISAKFTVIRQGAGGQPQEFNAVGEAPTASTLKKSPQELSIENFKSALGKQLDEIRRLLKPA